MYSTVNKIFLNKEKCKNTVYKIEFNCVCQ